MNLHMDPVKPQTLWDQYKFKWFVPCIEVVLFKRFQSHYIDRGIKFGDLVLFIVERYIMHCPFIGESSLRGSTVFILKNCLAKKKSGLRPLLSWIQFESLDPRLIYQMNFMTICQLFFSYPAKYITYLILTNSLIFNPITSKMKNFFLFL